MSSYVTWTLNNELERLNASHEELKSSHMNLRNFILSDEFLVDYNKFEGKLGEFQERIVTLVENISTPISIQTQNLQPPLQVPQQPQTQPPPETQPQEKHVWEKVVAVALLLLSVGLAITQGYVPPETLQWTVIGVFLVIAFPFLFRAIQPFFKRKEEEKTPSVKLEEWVHARLRWMRERHFKAWSAIVSDTPVKEVLEEYEVLGVDPVVYNKKEYFKKRLAFEFLSTLGEIMAACNTNVWTRKSMVISAIVSAQSPVAR